MRTNGAIYIINEVSRALKSAGFKNIHTKQEKMSEGKTGYTVYVEKETSTDLYAVRISNHICALHNFSDNYREPLSANAKQMRRMGKNIQRPYKPIHFYSVVFKEFDIQASNNAEWNLTCFEYVFDPKIIYNSGDEAYVNSISSEVVKLVGTPNVQGMPPSVCGVSPVIRERQNTNNLQEHTIYNKNNNKRNMKKTIKKNDLKRLVEGVLNELDWKTYMNAAVKSHKRGETDRSDDFVDAARKSYMNKFGGFEDGNSIYVDADHNEGRMAWPVTDTTFSVSGTSQPPYVDSTLGRHRDGDPYTALKNKQYAGEGGAYRFKGNPSFKDVDRYVRGNSKYTKGKGWDEVNESHNHLVDTITESVIRRLRRR